MRRSDSFAIAVADGRSCSGRLRYDLGQGRIPITCRRRSTPPSRAWPGSTTRSSAARTTSRSTVRSPRRRSRPWATAATARGSTGPPSAAPSGSWPARASSQFLDLGSGLPTVQNTHQIAQTINPAARVVYVDNDPSVSLHGKALLADDASTTVVLADIMEPDTLLASPEVRGLLDFGQPVGLITERGHPPRARRGGPARHRGPLQAGSSRRAATCR